MPAAWESAAADPTTTTSDTSMVVTKPAGLTVGDTMVAFGGCADVRTLSAPSGSWNVRLNNTDGNDRVYVWDKVADAADVAASNFTFTASGTFNNAIVSVHRASGLSSNAPTVLSGTGTNSTSQTCPTITAPSAGCLFFWGLFLSNATSASSSSKGTERIDSSNATSGCFMTQYTSVEAGSGAITGAAIVTAGFGAKRTVSICYEASGGGGGSFIDNTTPILAHIGGGLL